MGFLPLFEFLLSFFSQRIVLAQISTFGELQLGEDLPVLVRAGVSSDVVNELQGDNDNAIVIGNEISPGKTSRPPQAIGQFTEKGKMPV